MIKLLDADYAFCNSSYSNQLISSIIKFNPTVLKPNYLVAQLDRQCVAFVTFFQVTVKSRLILGVF